MIKKFKFKYGVKIKIINIFYLKIYHKQNNKFIKINIF